MTQATAEPCRHPCSLDLQRTARFSLVGLTLHGPFFYNGFRFLDSTFGTATTMQKVRWELPVLLAAPTLSKTCHLHLHQ